MTHQFTDSFEISVSCLDICFAEREAEITIGMEDDGCGDLAWHVVRVDAENLSGTGWLRWEHTDTKGHSFFNQLGAAFFRAALKDPLVEATAIERWQEAMLEAA